MSSKRAQHSPKPIHIPDFEPTKMEILPAINNFATRMEQRLHAIETTMVTKDYLDQRLLDLKTDNRTVVRREDQKFNTLVDVLYQRKVLTSQDVELVMTIQPFATLP